MHAKNIAWTMVGIAAFALVIIWDPKPQKPPPLPIPLEAPVPLLESTPTADAGAFVARSVPGKLPAPGPNQRRAGQCDPEQSQVEVNGGCWVQTTHPPPCPMGKQWEHEGRCWLPVGHAKPIPRSGDPRPLGVAEP